MPSPPAWVPDAANQKLMASQDARWQAFVARYPGWQASFDERTGLVEYAFGPGIQAAPEEPVEQQVREAALQWRDSIVADVYAQDPQHHPLLTVRRVGKLWYAHFSQTVGVASVFNGGLTLRIDQQGRLVMFGGRLLPSSFEAVPDGPDQPGAVEAALRFLRRELGRGLSIVPTATDAIVWIEDAGADTRVTKVRLVRTHVESEEIRPVECVVLVGPDLSVVRAWADLRSCGHGAEVGARDARASELACPGPPEATPSTVSGNVIGYVHEGRLPWESPLAYPMRDVTLNVDGTTVTSTSAGGYTACTPNPLVFITSLMDGPWIVGSASAPTPSASYAQITPAGTFDVIFDDTNSTPQERDLVYFTNKTRAFFSDRLPAQTGTILPVTGEVDFGTAGAAAYTPSSQNMWFGPATATYFSTATLGSVVCHEYGHHLHIHTYYQNGRVAWSWLAEAMADTIAACTQGDPAIGPGITGPGTLFRTLASNGCMYPASCGNTAHTRGLVLGGAIWDTRTLFGQRYGASGALTLEQMMLQSWFAVPLTETTVCLEMLLQDDDDGNLANGTPNADLFYASFALAHGIPFPIPPVTFTHLPIGDTVDQYQNYRIRSDVGAFNGTPILADVVWRVDNGPWNTTPMIQLSGTEWGAAIPHQTGPHNIDYYLRASDALGAIGTDPAAAPEAFHTFRTYHRVHLLRDSFESAFSWTTGAVPAGPAGGANDWQTGTPTVIPHPIAASENWLINFDPLAPYDGLVVCGTKIAVPQGAWWSTPVYSYNTNQWLDSPSIDASNYDLVRLRYARWLTVEDAVADQASISVSAQGAAATPLWQNATGADHLDTAWRDHELDLAPVADGRPDVRVRFQLTSNANTARGGWNVDDVRIIGRRVTDPLPLVSVGPAVGGGNWVLQVNGEPGDPYVIFAALAIAPTFYPGHGTASIDVFNPQTLLPVMWSGVIPITGQAFHTQPIPNVPGVAFYVQGVLGLDGSFSDLMLTNLLTVIIQ
jgi:hypothetical protein